MYDNIYAGNVPITIGEAGDIDTPIDWDKPFPEFGNNVNSVALRTAGLGNVPSTDTTQGYTVETDFFSSIWDTFNGQTLAPSINSIEARIQAEVAQFLVMKNTIVTLQNDSKVVTTDKVALQQLYNSQVSLEQSLQGNLGLINEIKLGNRSAVDLVTDVTSLSIFATQMEMHMDEVDRIASKYGYTASHMMGFSNTIMFAGLALVGYLIYKNK
jgi:hypothetical protein